jgi:hypothetical protein
MIAFEEASHTYTSLDGSDIKWLSVTTAVGQFKQPFNAPEQARKSAKNAKSKWHKMTIPDILAAWKSESDRACSLGNWYHAQREKDLMACDTVSQLPVFQTQMDERGRKIAPSQKLVPGVYPELMLYLKSAKLSGQSDLVVVTEDGFVNITDYKTNKEIKTSGYTNWEGITQKMSTPLAHLDDCHLNHYTMQLSLYMYIILKHNPNLKPGKLTIHHVIFEEEVEKDKYDYPITMRDEFGDPIVKHVIPYELKYLSSEVRSMLMWLAENQDKIRRK